MVNYKDFTSLSTSERINTLKAYELTPAKYSYINLKDRRSKLLMAQQIQMLKKYTFS